MKRTITILVFVICLLVLVVWADRRWPAGGVETHAQAVTLPAGTSPDSGSGLSDPALQNLPIPDLNGKNVTLADYKGKVVLVDFWATWCPPCRIEIPWLIDLQQKYASRGFVVLGISMDENGAEDVNPFLAKERFDVNGQKLPINYQILLGSDDCHKLWINGELVHTNRTHRAAAPEQDSVKVKLKKGKSTIVLKITNGDGPHGFYFMLLAEEELKRVASR